MPQVLNVSFRRSTLIDVAEDSINSILEPVELYKYLLRFLSYYRRTLPLRSAVLDVIIKECLNLVKGRSPKEREYL